MNNSVLKEAFIEFIDIYKIDKTKKLIKEMGDALSKSFEIDDIKKTKELLGNGERQINVLQCLKDIKSYLDIESFKLSIINMKLLRKWIKASQKTEDEYDYAIWLDWASKNAKNISFSTHIAKLTHSSIKGASNIYFDKEDKELEYFSTSVLNNKIVDISQTDNKLAPIGKLLQMEKKGSLLADKLKIGDVSDFQDFAKSEEQLTSWKEGFLLAFTNQNPSSHYLAKQMYFPVDDGYHMLSPLVSSSLDHALFEKIQYAKYSKEMKKIREQKNAGKYHHEELISYPKLAILMVTASNHSNASPLNGKRGGKRYLLPSTAPLWESSLQPPSRQSSLFYGEYERRVWREVKSLQKYLVELENKKSNKQIRDNVKRNINWIINTLFSYVAEIQNMRDKIGWSEASESLKESHKLWLDPYRKDKEFVNSRESEDWQDEVCLDFGKWLNKKLENKKMIFSKIESDKWAKLLKGRLREFERDMEVLR